MKTSKFKLIFLGVCLVLIAAGVAAFATYKGSSEDNRLPSITVWGTFPKADLERYVSQVNQTLADPLVINYTQRPLADFSRDFVSALARGAGPDAVLIPADILYANEDKLLAIPYSALPQRTFLNSYIDAGSVYLTSDGVLGIPFTIDPLVMYWNRDIFNAAGIAAAPRVWEDLLALNRKITVKDDNATVSRSGAALGDFANVVNAREILATLLFQAGNPIATVAADRSVASAFQPPRTDSAIPAVEFFAQFVNPSNPNYSWNRTWPDSKTAFLSGKLAIYFGLASELADIRAKNPNLNFDVGPVPQAKQGGFVSVYGRLHGLSIVRASPRANAAYQIMTALVQPANIAQLSQKLYLPSVSRYVISGGSTDPYIAIFNQAALISRAWLDAGPDDSRRILGTMVQVVTSGQKSVSQALREAGDQYEVALRQAKGQ